jgi:UDP-N-acetylglucosamine 1-carboxyvinyltransferase
MQKIIIEGPATLRGEINISGSKNASLPIMISSILAKGSCLISNVPNLRDTRFLVSILQDLGCKVDFQKNVFAVHNSSISKKSTDYEYVRQMRASIVLLGPVIARYKKFKIALPGGCSIGTRGIDLHLEALEKMGVKITIRGGYVLLDRKNNELNSINHKFKKISVGATQNIVMAATLAKGQSTLRNCAIEPEVIDLINFLNKCGAQIAVDKRTIKISGVEELNLKNHEIIPDRIEAGSYILAMMATKGKITLNQFNPDHLQYPLKIYEKMGLKINKLSDNSYEFSCPKLKTLSKISTKEYPGYPTDLQAQIIATLLKVAKKSKVQENIFENRFIHIPELRRFGANLNLVGNTAEIEKTNDLYGAEVMATDLRGSFSLVIAALMAKGTTTINRIYHLDRGYEDFDLKLKKCGVNIKRKK